jgi:L-ascorbate metabolism protein UlaG (beta-lactamase superfamily)
MTSTNAERVTVRLIGGPTALIDIGGLRLLTDPGGTSTCPVPAGAHSASSACPPSTVPTTPRA